MKDTFQIVFLAVFGLFIIAGLAVLALNKGGGGNKAAVPITVWGTLPEAAISATLADLERADKTFLLTYVEKRPETFNHDFIEALANGAGPDAVLLPQDLLFSNWNKFAPLPYGAMSARDFKNTFIQEGELFLSSNGIVAMPFAVDPLVMYWNRDLFNAAHVSEPPSYWDQFPPLAAKLTARDNQGRIVRSAVAMGEIRNIPDGKDVLSALMLEAGNPIAVAAAGTGSAGGFSSTLDSGTGGNSPVPSPVPALDFYAEFANPVKPDYSWSRSLPSAPDFFAGGDLAMYFGFASEQPLLRAKNPNLNFDVALFPQLRTGGRALTFGRLYGFAVVRTSPHASVAWSRMVTLSSASVLSKWSQTTGWPPVRRDLLAASPADPNAAVFYNAALSAAAWPDPDPAATKNIFQTMVESVTGGATDSASALGSAAGRIDALFRQ